MDEPFTLANDPPRAPRAEFFNEPGRQRALFSGLDCEPGQLDLFDTDGNLEETRKNQ